MSGSILWMFKVLEYSKRQNAFLVWSLGKISVCLLILFYLNYSIVECGKLYKKLWECFRLRYGIFNKGSVLKKNVLNFFAFLKFFAATNSDDCCVWYVNILWFVFQQIHICVSDFREAKDNP